MTEQHVNTEGRLKAFEAMLKFVQDNYEDTVIKMEKLKSEWEKILERTAEQRAHNGISLFFQKEGKKPCWLE